MAKTQRSPLPSSVKELSDSRAFSLIPLHYAAQDPGDPSQIDTLLHEQIPTIDLSVLIKGTPHQRCQMVQQLAQACQDWGFFMLVNHDMPEMVTDAMLKASEAFLYMEEEEKAEYSEKDISDPIRYGTSFNLNVDGVRYWRDYIRVVVHPVFHSPTKPSSFREALKEYAANTRVIATELLRAIWKSLELEENHMSKVLELDSCHQVVAANFYPPCPQPELAMGFPSHSDHGLLTLIFQNGVEGLQIKHGNRWLQAKALPNSYLVNIGDHMEIVSNGRYKSVVHRAMVNGESTRISIVSVVSPSFDAVVKPVAQLLSSEKPAFYRGISYREFLEYKLRNQLKDKSVLEALREQC